MSGEAAPGFDRFGERAGVLRRGVPLAASVELVTPPPDGTAALACIELSGDIDAVIEALGMRPVPIGSSAIRRLVGIDTLLIVRWGDGAASIMPHGGHLIVAALLRRLTEVGCQPGGRIPDVVQGRRWQDDPAEACRRGLAGALAAAMSPAAIDLLLQQPERWRRWCAARSPSEQMGWKSDAGLIERSKVLCRLLRPPTIAVVGPANVGKSTLLNTLAGANLSVVRDEVGTTRDHVGATVLLGGLAVRWLDTPGLIDLGTPEFGQRSVDPSPRSDSFASAKGWTDRAFELVAPAIRAADVLLLAGDGTRPALTNKELMKLAEHRIHSGWAVEWARRAEASPTRVLRVALRSDAFPSAGEHDVTVGGLGESGGGAPGGVALGTVALLGLDRLVVTLREALVPGSALRSAEPWAFWVDQ